MIGGDSNPSTVALAATMSNEDRDRNVSDSDNISSGQVCVEPEETSIGLYTSLEAVENEDKRTETSLSHALPCPGKSKRQQKRELKRQRWQEVRLEKRMKERERKRLKKQQLKEAGIEVKKSKPRRKMNSKLASNVRVAIDLSFNDLMVEKDLKKLTRQVRYCYTANRTSKIPVQLYLCCFGDENKSLFDKSSSGYTSWDVHFREERYDEVFDREDIVYLTAESDNVLKALEEDKVYIIGGLIDHNAHKGLCLKLAEEKGISHAQLPISEYLKMATRKVLTINHVMEILLNFVTSEDWEQALYMAIPKRKGASLLSEETDSKEDNEKTNETDAENPLNKSNDTTEDVTCETNLIKSSTNCSKEVDIIDEEGKS